MLITFWIDTVPPISPARSTPTELPPWTAIVPLIRLTLPVTAAVRMAALLSPMTEMVPALMVSDPASTLSIAMPADWLPSTVMLPLVRTFPVNVPPPSTWMPKRFVPCANGPSMSPSLSVSVAV